MSNSFSALLELLMNAAILKPYQRENENAKQQDKHAGISKDNSIPEGNKSGFAEQSKLEWPILHDNNTTQTKSY